MLSEYEPNFVFVVLYVFLPEHFTAITICFRSEPTFVYFIYNFSHENPRAGQVADRGIARRGRGVWEVGKGTASLLENFGFYSN